MTPLRVRVVRPRAAFSEAPAFRAVVPVGRGEQGPAGALSVVAVVVFVVFFLVNEARLPFNSESFKELDKDSIGTLPLDSAVIIGILVLKGEADRTTFGQELLVLEQVLERRFGRWLARVLFDFVLVCRRKEDIVRKSDPETRLHGKNLVLAIAVKEGPADVPSCMELGPLGHDGAALVSDLELTAGKLGGEAESECSDVVGAVRSAGWVSTALPHRGLETRSRSMVSRAHRCGKGMGKAARRPSHSLSMGLEEAAGGIHVELVQHRVERGLALELGMDCREGRSAGDEVMAETKLRGLEMSAEGPHGLTTSEADDMEAGECSSWPEGSVLDSTHLELMGLAVALVVHQLFAFTVGRRRACLVQGLPRLRIERKVGGSTSRRSAYGLTIKSNGHQSLRVVGVLYSYPPDHLRVVMLREEQPQLTRVQLVLADRAATRKRSFVRRSAR